MKRGEVCGHVSDCQLVMKVQTKDGDFIENVWKNPGKITSIKERVMFVMNWK